MPLTIALDDFGRFSLNAAAISMIAGQRKDAIKTVHNWTARGFLTFQGRGGGRKLPMYSLTGLIEFSTIYYLQQSGMPLSDATKVAGATVERAKFIATNCLDLNEEHNWRVLDFHFADDGQIRGKLQPESITIAELFGIRPVGSYFNARLFPVDALIARTVEQYRASITDSVFCQIAGIPT
jgi:hypothetical protein